MHISGTSLDGFNKEVFEVDANDWGQRISYRTDISMGLVHLTKGSGNLNALGVLMKILQEKTLIGSTNQTVDGHPRGFICGNNSVVCFQDVPLYSLSENVYWEQKLHKQNPNVPIRYVPFGLRFDKRYIFRNGGRPVIYEDTHVAKRFLPEDEYWRIVKLDLGNDENIIDWTHEREWRIKGDFHFDLSEVEILLSDQTSLKKFYQYCRAKNMETLLHEIKGIIVLKSLLF